MFARKQQSHDSTGVAAGLCNCPTVRLYLEEVGLTRVQLRKLQKSGVLSEAGFIEVNPIVSPLVARHILSRWASDGVSDRCGNTALPGQDRI